MNAQQLDCIRTVLCDAVGEAFEDGLSLEEFTDKLNSMWHAETYEPEDEHSSLADAIGYANEYGMPLETMQREALVMWADVAKDA
jgi:hypothetical protein